MRKRTYEGESGSDSDSTKTDVVAALENDLNIFEKESKIPVDLDWHVYSSTQILISSLSNRVTFNLTPEMIHKSVCYHHGVWRRRWPCRRAPQWNIVTGSCMGAVLEKSYVVEGKVGYDVLWIDSKVRTLHSSAV